MTNKDDEALVNDQRWLLNLMPADAFAKTYDLHRAGMIKRCARKMRDTAKSEAFRSMAKQIIAAPEDKVVGLVEAMYLNSASHT